MKQMKFIILASVIFLNINISFGQKKQYDTILNKVERNVDKNYYSDSISAVRHSEYIVNELTNDFEKVVCIEYFPTPMWSMDEKYYNQRFGFKNSIFPSRIFGYLITAKLYNKGELSNLGLTVPHRFASFYPYIDINLFNSTLSTFVRNNREKRREDLNNNNDTNLPNKINMLSFDTHDNQRSQKPTISVEYGNVNNQKTNNNSVPANNLPKTISMSSPPIYTTISNSTAYMVDNIIYNETDCYKLTRVATTNSIYTESDRQRFENTLDEYDVIFQKYLTEQQKNEHRQLVEYWANGTSVHSQTYVVTKKNFAVLSFVRELKRQNNEGKWIAVEKITEEYQEGKNKKYYPTFYTKLIRNYNGGFPNIDNLLTLVVRTPLEKSFSLSDTIAMPRKYKLAYEDFCERVDIPDDDMLLDWNKYNE